jgi:hypothetical protein
MAFTLFAGLDPTAQSLLYPMHKKLTWCKRTNERRGGELQQSQLWNSLCCCIREGCSGAITWGTVWAETHSFRKEVQRSALIQPEDNQIVPRTATMVLVCIRHCSVFIINARALELPCDLRVPHRVPPVDTAGKEEMIIAMETEQNWRSQYQLVLRQ